MTTRPAIGMSELMNISVRYWSEYHGTMASAGELTTILGTLGILAPFVAVAMWGRWKRSRRRRYVLVAVGVRSRWSIRPPLIRRPEDLAIVKQVGDTIDSS